MKLLIVKEYRTNEKKNSMECILKKRKKNPKKGLASNESR